MHVKTQKALTQLHLQIPTLSQKIIENIQQIIQNNTKYSRNNQK